jgi:hypothetical protein
MLSWNIDSSNGSSTSACINVTTVLHSVRSPVITPKNNVSLVKRNCKLLSFHYTLKKIHSTERMLKVSDFFRIAYFSAYLALCIPWCLYAAWRWHKHSHLPEIQERFPTLSLLAFILFPIANVSLALGRMLDYYPCSLLIWQDFAITYVTILVYLFRAFIYYFKYEWVHERLEYFEKSKIQQKVKSSTFFHRHRNLMRKEILFRIFAGIVVIEAIVPAAYSVLRRNDFRDHLNGAVCDSNGWSYFVYFGFALNLILMFVFAFKIRPARDQYNVRSDLRLGLFAVLGMYTLYVGAVFSGQYGISKRFPVSSFLVSACCVALSYIGAWRPVQSVLQLSKDESENATSRTSMSSLKRSTEMLGCVDINGSIYNSKQTQLLVRFLSEPVCRAEFKAFVMSAYAIENLLFFDSAIDFHLKWSSCSPEDLKEFRECVIEQALKIYKEYFHHDAVLDVNVSYGCKMKFKEQFDAALILDNTGSYSFKAVKFSDDELCKVFDTAFAEVLGMLHDDLFRKFKNTPQFSSCSAGVLTQFIVIDEDKKTQELPKRPSLFTTSTTSIKRPSPFAFGA